MLTGREQFILNSLQNYVDSDNTIELSDHFRHSFNLAAKQVDAAIHRLRKKGHLRKLAPLTYILNPELYPTEEQHEAELIWDEAEI